MKSKKVAIKGEIVSEPSIWTSGAGTACCKFSVRTTDAIYECIAFHERANIEGMAKGKVITIRGSYRDQEAFESKSITVDTAIVEGGKTSLMDMIIKEHGSLANYKKYLADVDAQRRAKGQIMAKYVATKDGESVIARAWFDKKLCVFHPKSGDWWLAIDFCMNVLGASEVTKRLKNAGISFNPNAVNGYKQILGELIEESLDLVSEEAPF